MPSKSPTARFFSPFSRSFCRVRTQKMYGVGLFRPNGGSKCASGLGRRGRVWSVLCFSISNLNVSFYHSVIYPNPERRSFLTNSATTNFWPCQDTFAENRAIFGASRSEGRGYKVEFRTGRPKHILYRRFPVIAWP